MIRQNGIWSYIKLLGTEYTHVSKFGELGGDIAFAANPHKDIYNFINRKGEPDTTGVDLNKIRDSATRAGYFNQKNGTKYQSVGAFGEYGENAAKAFEEGKGRFFINREGIPDASGVDLNAFDDSYDRATVYNQTFGTDYDEITNFDSYGKGIAIANDIEGHRYFVNKKGKRTTVGVETDLLPDSLNALYINQKYKKDYKTVGAFGQYVKANIAVARTKDNRNVLINEKGELDVTGVDPKKMNDMDSNIKAAYFNTMNGTNFTDIYDTLTNNQTNVLFGSLPNGGYAFVDNKGKLTTKIKNLEMMIKQYGENTVNNTIEKTKEMIAGKLKENYSPIQSLVNEELSNYFQK